MMIPVELKEDIQKVRGIIVKEDKYLADCAEWKVFNYLLASFLKDNKEEGNTLP